MKNHVTILIITLSAAVLILFGNSCNRGKSPAVAENLPAGMHGVSVIEVIQTSNYTYLQVFENNEKYWIAVNAREAKPGDVLYFTQAMEMYDFESKELNRTFPLVYFVQDVTESPDLKQVPTTMGKPNVAKVTGIEIEPVEGAVNIAAIFAGKEAYAGKTVKIRGLVVKFNAGIMDKNWVHLQDGTGDDVNYDLTITTLDVLEVGSIATFEGKIEIDKDFGAGYTYEVIMEDAKASDLKTPQVTL
ncbi:MAG: SH3-like domain-containing protein [Lentimicrobium sp.]|nr:SH3-like domain-containing protein [Lentimicrobium sp.]